MKDVILRHPFPFDADFYRRSYPDVVAGGDVEAHFVAIGYEERRYGSEEHLAADMQAIARSGTFDAAYYQAENGPQVDPVRHYLLNWQIDDRRPNEQFDARFVEDYYNRTLAPGENPYSFYCRHKTKTWCFPNIDRASAAIAHLRRTDLFPNAADMRRVGTGALVDSFVYYCTEGFRALEPASERFDTRAYMQQYPDIASVCINPLAHFIDHGSGEGRASFPSARRVSLNGRAFDPDKETVLIASHEASRSGAPIVGLNLARHLADRFNVISFLLRAGPLVDDFVSVSQLVVVSGDQIGDIVAGLSLVLSTRSLAAAILNSAECAKCLPLLVENSIPAISLIHEFAQYMWHLGLLEKAIVLSDAVVFPAEVVKGEAMKEFARLGMVPSHPTNLHVRPQGRSVLPPHGSTDGGRSIALLKTLRSASDRPLVVLGAGFVQPRKGVDLFIEAARIMKVEKRTPCIFVWVGSNYRPQEDMVVAVYLADQIVQSGLNDTILFIDELPTLDDLWPLVDAFFMSSRLDPFPNVALDAIAARVPVVCFRSATGIAELAERCGENVAAVPYGDCGGAVDALLRMGRSKKPAENADLDAALSFARYAAFLETLIGQGRERLSTKLAMAKALQSTGYDAGLFDRSAPLWLKSGGFGVAPDVAGRAKVAITAALNGIDVGLLEPGRAAVFDADREDDPWAAGAYIRVGPDASRAALRSYSAILFTTNPTVLERLAKVLYLMPFETTVTVVTSALEISDVAGLQSLVGRGDVDVIAIEADSDPSVVAERLRARHAVVSCLHLLVDGAAGVSDRFVAGDSDDWLFAARSASAALAGEAQLQSVFAPAKHGAWERRASLMLRCDSVSSSGPLVERMVAPSQVWLRSANPKLADLLAEVYRSFLTLGDTHRLFHRLCEARFAEDILSQWAIIDDDRDIRIPHIDLHYGRETIADHALDGRREDKRPFFKPRQRRGPADRRFNEQELKSARMLWPKIVGLNWNAVDVVAGSGRILVHPLPRETTIAILSGIVPAGITSLSAEIAIDNEEAKDIEFGLAAIHRRQKYEAPETMILQWHRLSAGEKRRIEGTIELANDASIDIFLATRMHDDGDPRLAWAYFSDLSVTTEEMPATGFHP